MKITTFVRNGVLFLATLILFFTSCTKPKSLTLSSPSNNVQLSITVQNQDLSYQLNYKGQEVISSSKLSIFPSKKVRIVDVKTLEKSEKWNPVWGQFSEMQDHFKEQIITLDYEGTAALLHTRAYDQGIAIRFEIKDKPIEIEPSLMIDYTLSDLDECYMPAGEREPLGPIEIASLATDSVKIDKWAIPIVVETEKGPYMSFLESDLANTPGFDAMNITFDNDRKRLTSRNNFKSDENHLTTPWRVILVEDKIGDLLTNTVPLNVATPNKIEDPSWIKPGKTMWDWRVHGYTTSDGFTYGVDTESYLRFIDFASENGIEYFLIDDSWYTDVKPGKMVFSTKLDLDKISKYAIEKEVSVLLYYDRRKGDFGDDALFSYYKSLGMKGIKYGFMGSKAQFTRDAIRRSAENNLLINFHDGPVPLTGISRTFPNAVAREYCHAQQDSRRAFTTEAFLKMAMINAIQGPLDMNNGIFDITGVNSGKREKGPLKVNSLHTTVVGEAARTLIIFSGLVCIPDAPEAYQEKSDLFEFIKKLPVGQWDETRILHAKMGEYITTARRHEDEWYIGSVHRDGGTLSIPLDFLENDRKYLVTYFEDTESTDSQTNPEDYRISIENVKKGDVVNATMARDGGHCMWIVPD